VEIFKYKSLDQKIGKNRCGPQFGPDQRVQRGGDLEGIKRGRTVYHLDGLMIMSEDANLQLGSIEWIRHHFMHK
jgi:hypothetical protein